MQDNIILLNQQNNSREIIITYPESKFEILDPITTVKELCKFGI